MPSRLGNRGQEVCHHLGSLGILIPKGSWLNQYSTTNNKGGLVAPRGKDSSKVGLTYIHNFIQVSFLGSGG